MTRLASTDLDRCRETVKHASEHFHHAKTILGHANTLGNQPAIRTAKEMADRSEDLLTMAVTRYLRAL